MKKELTLCRLSVWAATTVILGVTLPPTASAQVEGDPTVEFAEPNWGYQHTFSSGTTANAIKAVDYIIDLTDRVNLRATTLGGTLAIPAAPFVP